MRLAYASDDLSTIAFTSEDIVGEDSDIPAAGEKAYEYHRKDGSVHLASRLPGSGSPVSVPSGIAGGSTLAAEPSSAQSTNAVSRDGRHIFFATHVGGGGAPNESADEAVVYRRTDGVSSRLATPSQRSTPDPQGQKRRLFQMATPDGRFVFFTSAELLTDDANTGPSRDGMDLYRYDFQTDDLIAISATTGGDGAKVERVIASSDDGSRVYYVARGVVTSDPGPTGEVAVDGGYNIYMWDGGEDDTVFVTRVDAADEDNWLGSKVSRTTAEGDHLMLLSVRDLTAYPSSGATQTYLYEAVSEAGGGDSLVCVSCVPGDSSPNGVGVDLAVGLPDGALSANGEYVVFETADAHVARDTNGENDVYAWTDGSVQLISSGRAQEGAEFGGAGENGATIFFGTRAQLVPSDTDPNVDVYTARVDGGLGAQHPTEAIPCQGDLCQGQPARQQPSPSVGSIDFRGTESGATPQRPTSGKLSVRRLRAPSGALARIKVRVPDAGRVVLAGRAVRRSARVVPRAGGYGLQVRLKPRARRLLVRRGGLRTTVRVLYRPRSGRATSRRVALAFKRPARAIAGRSADRRAKSIRRRG